MNFSNILYKSNSHRSSLIIKNVMAGAVVKMMSILCSLLLVPLTINYISSELYGIWLTLSSVIHWIGFFDIGFGNGLRNKLGEAIALNNFKRGKGYVSTTYAVISILFFIIAVFCFLIVEYIDWASLLNVSKEYNSLLINLSKILILSFSCQIVLKIIQNVIQAFQHSALASLLDALGNVFSLVFIYLLTITMAPDLISVGIVFCISPLCVLLIASLILYSGRYKKVAPSLRFVRFSFAGKILRLGGEFFIIQIAVLILYQMVNVIISHFCGPEEVTNYNVAYKYLSISTMIVNIITTPFWSAFTDAFTKRDIPWMTNIYKKMMKLFFLVVILIVLMVIISPIVYHLWIGNTINIPLINSTLIGVFMIISAWTSIHIPIINGIGKVRVQLIYSIITMVSFLPLAFLLGNYFGLVGILSSMIIINMPGVIFSKVQTSKLIKGEAKGIWNK